MRFWRFNKSRLTVEIKSRPKLSEQDKPYETISIDY